VRGADRAEIDRKLAPVQAEVRKRLGNFILGEDDQTLEGVVLAELSRAGGSLAVVETFTGGGIAARIVPLPGAEAVFRRGVVARDLGEIAGSVGLEHGSLWAPITVAMAEHVASAARLRSEATHALAVLIDLDTDPDQSDLGGTICLAIADGEGVVSRESRIMGGRDWVRLGAIELALDCLRRHLQHLPVTERTDFEKA
jgi:nicotinamide-nucleotide amidase